MIILNHLSLHDFKKWEYRRWKRWLWSRTTQLCCWL